MFKFAAIADTQYSQGEDFKDRRFQLSLGKLKGAVSGINKFQPDFTVQLGDLIDCDSDNFSAVIPILDELDSEYFSVLGNHDLYVSDSEKRRVWKTLKMPYKYYARNHCGWKLLFLDGNDISLSASSEGSDKYNAAQKYFDSIDSQSEWWNGAVGERQKEWLENELAMAQKQGSKVMIFCHFPLLPDSRYCLWNSDEILKILSKYSVVKSWMNGHQHSGDYVLHRDVHFVTFKGMVETEENSYAEITVTENSIEIKGHGREESRILDI